MFELNLIYLRDADTPCQDVTLVSRLLVKQCPGGACETRFIFKLECLKNGRQFLSNQHDCTCFAGGISTITALSRGSRSCWGVKHQIPQWLLQVITQGSQDASSASSS